VIVATQPFESMPRPIIDGRPAGFCKLIIDREPHLRERDGARCGCRRRSAQPAACLGRGQRSTRDLVARKELLP
jgi:hypothetical protein